MSNNKSKRSLSLVVICNFRSSKRVGNTLESGSGDLASSPNLVFVLRSWTRRLSLSTPLYHARVSVLLGNSKRLSRFADFVKSEFDVELSLISQRFVFSMP